ncbi:MAG: hypothetical protein M3Q03_03395 [Chloroflexota bacterium]|nr:hypothetical protein [Chloroflexota bacterium]
MLDDLLDVFDRDRRHGARKRGLGGLIRHLIGNDDRRYRDDHRRGRREHDDDHRDRWFDDRDDSGDRPRRHRRGVNFDLD